MISSKEQLVERNLQVSAKAEEIRAALRLNDESARDLFDALRATDPAQAQQVANALAGGAR